MWCLSAITSLPIAGGRISSIVRPLLILTTMLTGQLSLFAGSAGREDSADPPLLIPMSSAERGLARAELERKPIFLLVLPPDEGSEKGRAEAFKSELNQRVGGSTRKRLEKDYVSIEVAYRAEGGWPKAEPAGPEEDPVPWDSERARALLEKRLGAIGQTPVVALLDFSGRVFARFDDETPSGSKLRKLIRDARGANAEFKKVYERAEKLVEVFGIALKKKKYPEACRAYLEAVKLDIPLDCQPAVDRAKRFDELEEVFEKRITKVEELEKKELLGEAVGAYEKILASFPIPQWQDRLRARIGILWRKIYGPNPPGGIGGTGGGR